LIYLESVTKTKRRIRHMFDEYHLKDGRNIYLIGEGRLANLTAAEGHPAMVMDMSFADQSLSAEYLVQRRDKLLPQVYEFPEELTNEVATLKLKSMGIVIDKLTAEQKAYLSGWKEGAFAA
jgi:adenosylhomocysteinase